jgi:hypothetical protein
VTRVLDIHSPSRFAEVIAGREVPMAGKKRGRKSRKNSGSYLSPGVYVEEVPAGAKPIEGVGTAVAAFVGLARTRPVRAASTLFVVAAGVALVVWAVRGRSG